MQKRILGYSLVVLGLGGMALAGYLFVTGTGGRGHLVEVTSYMIVGAACFFAGINYIYESANAFTMDHLQITPDLEEVSPIQQQWRTIHIARQPVKQVREQQITANAV
jgi:hypothetical protein